MALSFRVGQKEPRRPVLLARARALARLRWAAPHHRWLRADRRCVLDLMPDRPLAVGVVVCSTDCGHVFDCGTLVQGGAEAAKTAGVEGASKGPGETPLGATTPSLAARG